MSELNFGFVRKFRDFICQMSWKPYSYSTNKRKLLILKESSSNKQALTTSFLTFSTCIYHHQKAAPPALSVNCLRKKTVIQRLYLKIFLYRHRIVYMYRYLCI